LENNKSQHESFGPSVRQNNSKIMVHDSTPFKNSILSKIFFLSSIIVFVFWILGQAIDVYHFALVGTIFEILWLPMIAMVFFLPIISLVFLVKEKFDFRSLYLYTFIIAVTNILLMVL
jgi:hypothetical protein